MSTALPSIVATRREEIKMQLNMTTRLMLGLGMLLGMADGPRVAADDRIDLIRESWDARRELSKNLHIRFSSVRVEEPPSREISDSDRKSGRIGPRPHRLSSEMWFSGDRIAISIERNPSEVPWLPARDFYVHTERGSQYISTRFPGRTFDASATGGVSRKQRVGHFGLYQVFFPPILSYRATESGPLSFSLSTAVIDEEVRKIGNIECLALIVEKEGEALETTEVWVDAARDFLPLRIITRLNQIPNRQFDLTFNPHPKVGYALSTWKFTSMKSNGELLVSEDVSVQVFDVESQISDTQFMIQYPPGATVSVDGLPERVQVGPNGEIPGYTVDDSKPLERMAVGLAVAGIVLLFIVWMRFFRRLEQSENHQTKNSL